MITINNLEKMKKYYDKRTNTYVFNDNVLFTINIKVKSSIKAWDIKAKNINAWNIKAWNINAWNVKANDIEAYDINANVIKCNSFKKLLNNKENNYDYNQ